ncbi:MAG TPA: kelch repeat-containing protein [Thermoplasmata archaeon]
MSQGIEARALSAAMLTSDFNEWTRLTVWPSGRFGHSMAYDSESDRMILFGGDTGGKETWAYDFDSNEWTNMNPGTSPSNRHSHAMAYDSQSDRVILFGGLSEGYNGETWAYDYDNNAWTNLNPDSNPPGRINHAMAYDAQSDRVVLFGGFYYIGTWMPNDETWVYDSDSNTWTQKNPSIRPSARELHAMAYDSESDQVVLFGGNVRGANPLSDETWTYNLDSNTWTQKSPGVRPSARECQAMVYHAQSGRVVLFGGLCWSGYAYESWETWTYDVGNTTWTNMNPGSRPSPRQEHSMIYDAQSNRVILFGGWDGTYGSGTWSYVYEINQWSDLNVEVSPSARFDHEMIYDSQSDRMILFGGSIGGYSGAPSNDTWAYNFGTNIWTNMIQSANPSARIGHSMAYDAQSDRVLLFGGACEVTPSPNNETWAYDYDNNTWINMDPVEKPPARYDHAMTYDSRSGQMIIFGGYNLAGLLNDTWVYDFSSNTWTDVNPPQRPSARRGCSMAYDVLSDRVVLFGGSADGYYSDETWIYDLGNNSWIDANPVGKPSARDGHVMTYDAGSNRMILFGGGADYMKYDTWVFDAANNIWTILNPSTNPSPRRGHTMVFDAQSDCTILFGGYSRFGDYSSSYDDETWAYVSPTTPSAPTGLQIQPGDSQVLLEWAAPVSDGGAPVSVYRIYRGTESGNLSLLIEWTDFFGLPGVLAYYDTGLTNGDMYCYQISAVNAFGEGTRCDEVQIVVGEPIPEFSGAPFVVVLLVAIVLITTVRRRKGP